MSNVTGEWITAEQAKDPGYWVSQLRRCVRFGDGLARLVKETEASVLLEVGPGAVLSHLAPAVVGGEVRAVSSLRGTKEGDRASVLRALGRQYASGWLLGLVALGLVAFGVFGLVEARHRTIPTD